MHCGNIRYKSSCLPAAGDSRDVSQAGCQVRGDLRRLQAVFDASPDSIFLIDPATMTFIDANQAACLTLGYSSDELFQMEVQRVAPEVSHERLDQALTAHSRAPGTTATIDTTQRVRDGSESSVCWHIHATETDKGPLFIVFARGSEDRRSRRDETLEAFLLTDLGHDPLTRLPNRRLFQRRLQRAVILAHRRPDYAFAVLFVDLDGFKAVNDTFGHQSGDYVLREFARRLSRSVRPGDVVARVGGDEFTVLVDNVREENDAVRIAQRIQAYTELPLDLNGHVVSITASIGIAQSSRGYERPQSILRDADRAMYFAKAAGRSPHVFEADENTLRREGQKETAIATVATQPASSPTAQHRRPVPPRTPR